MCFRDLSGICLQVSGKLVKKVGVNSDLFGVSGIENFPPCALGGRGGLCSSMFRRVVVSV